MDNEADLLSAIHRHVWAGEYDAACSEDDSGGDLPRALRRQRHLSKSAGAGHAPRGRTWPLSSRGNTTNARRRPGRHGAVPSSAAIQVA